MQLIHLTKQDFLIDDKSPIDLVTPDFIGQMYIQRKKAIYVATNLTKKDWFPLQPLIDISEIEGDIDDLGSVIVGLSNELTKLKPFVTSTEANIKDINMLKNAVASQLNVVDMFEVLKATINLKNYYDKSKIDDNSLVYDTLISDIQRRLKALEIEGKIPCTGVSVNSEMNLNSIHPKVLNVKLSPFNTTDLVEYTSDNSGVVTVNRGVITPTGANGSATIKVTCGNRKAECKVTVKITEEVETIDNLIATSEELFEQDGYVVAPVIVTLPPSIKLEYLVWDLYFNDSVICTGTYTHHDMLSKVTFDCKYINKNIEYSGVKLRAKTYDPITGEFKVIALSNDISIRFTNN